MTSSDVRNAARDSLFLQATMRREDGSGSAGAVRVRNLSAGGMMAECTETFNVGDRVELDLRGVGAQGGQVVWVELGRYGICFDRPINPRLVRKPIGPVAPPVRPGITMTPDAKLRRPGLLYR